MRTQEVIVVVQTSTCLSLGIINARGGEVGVGWAEGVCEKGYKRELITKKRYGLKVKFTKYGRQAIDQSAAASHLRVTESPTCLQSPDNRLQVGQKPVRREAGGGWGRAKGSAVRGLFGREAAFAFVDARPAFLQSLPATWKQKAVISRSSRATS